VGLAPAACFLIWPCDPASVDVWRDLFPGSCVLKRTCFLPILEETLYTHKGLYKAMERQERKLHLYPISPRWLEEAVSGQSVYGGCGCAPVPNKVLRQAMEFLVGLITLSLHDMVYH
jgi:hypothetical protein